MKFWEENGKGNGRRSTGSGHGAALLENPESHLRWYFKYFLGTAHQNYYGKTTSKDLFILSIVKSDEDYRAILWAKSGLQRLYLPMSHKPRTPHSICQEFGDIDVVRAPKEIKQADIQKDLLYIEEQEGAINFKFGVLYRRHGQCTDDEILGNNGITPAFQRFLDLIGEKVALKGFNEYRGGLDVKGDTTGTHSYRTIMEGKHIMFHVANLLPFTKDNPQQVERKRHIGNDIVNIVFQEDYDDFDPTCFKSHMSHIYALVTYQHTTDSYLLRVYNESSVPRYGPEISVEYTDIDHFRHVLLVKLMNGEKAVYATPQFVARRERTIQQLLKEIYNRYVRSNEDFDHLRPIADKIMDTTPRIGRKKRIRKAAKFQAKGQDLKVQKIISGHAPTSKTCTSDTLQRKFEHYSTWHYDRIVRDFRQRIICADFWDTYIILGTDSGLSLINTSCADESGIAEIYDHNMFVPKQISVIEEKSVVVVRAEKGKHKTGYVYIFDLSALTMKSHCTKNFKRKTKQERLQGTKGCTNLCAHVSKMSGDLHMAVVKHKIIQLYEWNKIPAQGQGWFTLKRDFQVCDVQSLCMFNRPSGLKICAGTSTEFLIIDTEAPEDDKTKCIERLQTHKENSSICITPVIKEDINNWAIGVLLTYNNISLLEQFAFTLHPDNIFSLLIKWNVKPVHIHSSLPYLIAIGQQGIEMRMASNGNVVHSIDVASVSYLAQRCQHIYLSTWDHVTCLSEIISLPTTTVSLYSSSSTISSAGLGGLSNDSFDDEDELTDWETMTPSSSGRFFYSPSSPSSRLYSSSSTSSSSHPLSPPAFHFPPPGPGNYCPYPSNRYKSATSHHLQESNQLQYHSNRQEYYASNQSVQSNRQNYGPSNRGRNYLSNDRHYSPNTGRDNYFSSTRHNTPSSVSQLQYNSPQHLNSPLSKLRLNTAREYHSQTDSEAVETPTLSMSSLDLRTEERDEMGVAGFGPPDPRTSLAARRGYDLHCNVFLSYTAELYRVMSVELTRNIRDG